MVDKKYGLSNYKSLKISTGAAIANPEMLRFVPDHPKTTRIYKNLIKKLLFVKRYVSDQYNIQEMCDKAILENSGTSRFVSNCCKIKKCVINLLITMFMH